MLTEIGLKNFKQFTDTEVNDVLDMILESSLQSRPVTD